MRLTLLNVKSFVHLFVFCYYLDITCLNERWHDLHTLRTLDIKHIKDVFDYRLDRRAK